MAKKKHETFGPSAFICRPIAGYMVGISFRDLATRCHFRSMREAVEEAARASKQWMAWGTLHGSFGPTLHYRLGAPEESSLRRAVLFGVPSKAAAAAGRSFSRCWADVHDVDQFDFLMDDLNHHTSAPTLEAGSYGVVVHWDIDGGPATTAALAWYKLEHLLVSEGDEEQEPQHRVVVLGGGLLDGPAEQVDGKVRVPKRSRRGHRR